MGRIESGAIAVGDAVTVLPGGRSSRIRAIHIHGQPLPRAVAEQSVTLLLDDEIDVSRGDMLVRRDDTPPASRTVRADLCWLSEQPFDPRRRYLIRHTTREVSARLAGIESRLNIQTLCREDATDISLNDIARVSLLLSQPIFADPYRDNRSTGAFIVIDEASNNTVGAGMIV
jgi:sulfate adenylyltransferase subunit 1